VIKDKMKRKAIHAELRKESQTFDGWLKYEVTIQNEDGSTEKVPAYGKDLQDALSRVVHDEKVQKLEKRTKRIPDLVWAVLWFGYMFGWTMLTYEVSPYDKFDGLFFVGGIALITGVTVWAKSWFRKRNISK
jgi:hypothetical protein